MRAAREAFSSIQSCAAKEAPIYSARQVPQCVGSALQLFPLPSVRRHDQKSGNESSGQDFRSTRPSLAVNYTAHVADSQRFLLGPLLSKTSARADSQRRRSPVPFRIASGARKRESCERGGVNPGAFLPERGIVMHNRIDIDSKHSRAIVQEIGERLRTFLKEESELPGSLRAQIDRLRELEEQSPSIIPAAGLGQASLLSRLGQHGLLGRHGRTMPSVKRRASKILDEYGAAQSELIGKTVVLTDGKAGTVENVWLDELHGLRISIEGHEGRWPVSTIKLVES